VGGVAGSGGDGFDPAGRREHLRELRRDSEARKRKQKEDAQRRHHAPSILENATVCGRAWHNLLDAPVLILDVTI